ncbi:MAG: CvpA family protein [Cytophagales bacterium]|nr:CvpA family protein [Bernardetiaceae bacterium]MDW8210976.1 CvpA family protein [Cytophagales bacterium]
MMLLSSLLAQKFSLLDIIVIFIVGWGGYKGFQKGFLVEFFSLLLFLLSLWLIFWLISYIFQLSASRIGLTPPKVTAFFALMLFYILIIFFISFLDGKFKESKFNKEVFEGFDGIVGLIFGVIKYALGLSIAIELVVSAGITTRSELINNTVTYFYLNSLFNYTLEIGSALAPSIAELVENIRYLLR